MKYNKTYQKSWANILPTSQWRMHKDKSTTGCKEKKKNFGVKYWKRKNIIETLNRWMTRKKITGTEAKLDLDSLRETLNKDKVSWQSSTSQVFLRSLAIGHRNGDGGLARRCHLSEEVKWVFTGALIKDYRFRDAASFGYWETSVHVEGARGTNQNMKRIGFKKNERVNSLLCPLFIFVLLVNGEDIATRFWRLRCLSFLSLHPTIRRHQYSSHQINNGYSL